MLLVIPFLIIITTSGCYNNKNEKSFLTLPTQTIIVNTKVPLSTPSEIPLQSSTPTQTYIPTNTPVYTPSHSKVNPTATKAAKTLPKKTQTAAAKTTPTPLNMPSITNKTPVITCDGDVCRIIID